MKVLIACEESQEVCKAFRELGHEAYSCDVEPCSGGHPDWHIQDNVLNHLNDGWDLMIAHPPCTYLSRAGTRWLFPKGELNKERYNKGLKAKEFFMKFVNADIPMIAVENPVPHKIFDMPKETQIVQPYEYGHKVKKTTLLWLKGLPKLKSTNSIFNHVQPDYYIDKKGIRHSILTGWSQKRKSKTFSGIARAMAQQWSKKTWVKIMGIENMTDKEKIIRNKVYRELQEVIEKYSENLIPKSEIRKDIEAVFDSLGYNDVGEAEFKELKEPYKSPTKQMLKEIDEELKE